MIHSHDPLRQVNYLQQCLSNDRKPLGLFLGAGCPVSVKSTGQDPLIPDIEGITRKVRTRLYKCKTSGPLLKLVEEHLATDGLKDTNIEDMLSHIRGLRAVAGNDKVRGLTAKELDTLDSKICEMISELANKSLPDGGTPYHRIALWTDAVLREYPIEVFTTNYDLLLEQAFESCRVPYFDGFAGSRCPYFDIRSMEEDKLPPRWARLWKLHGSINWYHDSKGGVARGARSNDELKRVIHPSHLKYEESRRMPYLAMIDRLRGFIKQPASALVISGYSFRDDHINEAIVQGLQATQTSVAFALLFDELAKYQKAIDLALRRTNLTLLASDGGVVGGFRAKWTQSENDSTVEGDVPWISMSPVNSDQENGALKAKLCLGDFDMLGKFFHALVGSLRQEREGENGK